MSLGKDPHFLTQADLDGDERLLTIQAFQKQHERIRRALDLKLVGEGDAVIPERLAIWLNDAAFAKVLGMTQKPKKEAKPIVYEMQIPTKRLR
ncbi:MAG: hypothetical protein KF735_12850 [Chelatococcus sp.]|uniref:hypothetical protein n=1 Tax=Chelatococcus sp. TaxID=1953771 RepID=UPI0025C160A3|nr:hypothetical protein [Chelatococcus sp.]MBX3538527.1 hypothetical protein [Chelatococcus sp.]